jgi:hypothetical protein
MDNNKLSSNDISSVIYTGMIYSEANHFCFKNVFHDPSSASVSNTQKTQFTDCVNNFVDLAKYNDKLFNERF